jgi:hypothetical protein
MNRVRTITLVIAMAWSVAASAQAWLGVLTGNDTGGIIPWSPEHQLEAQEWADYHCARYHKFAQITSIRAQYGDYIAFDCNWRRPLGYRPSQQD